MSEAHNSKNPAWAVALLILIALLVLFGCIGYYRVSLEVEQYVGAKNDTTFMQKEIRPEKPDS